jgi:hypothetical protein
MDGHDGSEFRFAPVTPATLEDLERFSLAYGKFRYCSCLLRFTPMAGLRTSRFRRATGPLCGTTYRNEAGR